MRVQLGSILTDAGQRDRAVALFRTIAADPRADVGNITEAGWGLYMAGERADAARVVSQAVALDPDHGRAFYLRGWLRLTAGELDGAASDFREAYERTPRRPASMDPRAVDADVAALYYEGVAHQKAGRAAEAAAAWTTVVTECEKVLRSEPNPVARWEADVLAVLGRVRLGRAVSPLEGLEEDEAQSTLAEARLHALQGKRAETLQDLRKALSLGAGGRQRIRDEPDFDALRASPEFVRLLQTGGPGQP